MAKRAARPKLKPALSGAPRPHSLVWLQGLLCGALVTLATPTALLLGVLLAPALLAVVLDQQPGRPTARSIALCGMAASVGPLRTLWAAGHTLAEASMLASNLRVLGIAWSAAAAGWLLAEVAPIAVRAVLDGISQSRAAQLRAARARLVDAWGLEAADPDQWPQPTGDRGRSAIAADQRSEAARPPA